MRKNESHPILQLNDMFQRDSADPYAKKSIGKGQLFMSFRKQKDCVGKYLTIQTEYSTCHA